MTIGHRTLDIQRGTYRPNAVKTTSPDHLVNTGNSQRHLLGPFLIKIYRDDDCYEKGDDWHGRGTLGGNDGILGMVFT